MKKAVASLLFVAFVVFGIHSIARGADVIKLKAANYLPATHKMSLLTDKFCQEIKKRTNGRVEITYHAGGTLLTAPKMFTGITTDVADIGVSHIQYTRGRFPVTEVFDLPLGFPSGWVATQVVSDFYNKFKPAEWDSVHVLYINTSGPLILQTVSKPVKTLEDMKGLKVRAVGQLTETVKLLGAVPVPLEMADVYDALRRGVLEGVMVDLSTLKYWKFAEVVNNVTSMWRLGTGITFYCVMNKNKWNSLPPDIQKIFTEVAGEAKEWQAALWNEMDIEGRDVFKAKGGQIIPLSDAEVTRWEKAIEPVIGTYKKDMASKGFKASDVDGWISFIKERTGYWTKQEKQKGIPSPFLQ
jgi:TRAP-type C4-dicarboxylate transport system substrate-binding protein